MALLTDVFPTNDCSICVLAPKMTDVYNHPLITLITYAEILNIEGSIGRFTISGVKKARFVDEKLCRIHPDSTLETVRDQMKYRGKMIWQENTLYIYNGGRVYNRLFANVVRVPDLF